MTTKPSIASDREIFEYFIHHENLRKIRVSFDFLLGRPLWWASFKLNGNAKAFKKSLEASYEIWNDPRINKVRFYSQIYAKLKKRSKETGANVGIVVDMLNKSF